MLKNIFKDWKTTAAGIVAAVLMIGGLLLPEKFDPTTQVEINSAVAELVSGLGALIAVITALVAKDPVTSE